ncbi:MAG TPA: outer membrane protein transport protein [Flavobacteriaceae bacterium]|nr:outer membrane protein transport protein [Flavobacteriaceae bacterium]
MKKLSLLFIGALSMSNIMAQDISDAVRYSLDEVQGTARFRAMSGAFGALGGDLSAVSINPAGSAIFNRSYSTFTVSDLNTSNDVNYFNGFSTSSDSKFDLNQLGAVFVFSNTAQNSPWKKLALSVGYDKLSSFDNDWYAVGTNTNSIDSYFLSLAQGLRLDEISALPGESLEDAYAEIGSIYGFQNQQAFLGYESYILEPNMDTDDNTGYTSNIAPGTFDQDYSYSTRGYNGKLSFNAASQFQDNLYLGLNLNAHFIDFDKSTYLHENNSNVGSLVNEVGFENNLHATGTGFSFQLGAILKLSEELRAGLTYNSPTWFKMSEETTQYLATVRNEGGSDVNLTIDPNTVNVYPDYTLQTPGKVTGSLAYVFGDQGLISFDYSLKDYENTKFKPTSDSYFAAQNNIIGNSLKSASTYKFGGEYRYKEYSFRGGYRFEESPYKDSSLYGDLTGFSLGLGYNFGNMKLDLAFDQSDRSINYPLYANGLTDRANVDSRISNIILSLGFDL